MQKYNGLVEVIGKTFYQVQLPSWMKIHSIIHVSNLKPIIPSWKMSNKMPLTVSLLQWKSLWRKKSKKYWQRMCAMLQDQNVLEWVSSEMERPLCQRSQLGERRRPQECYPTNCWVLAELVDKDINQLGGGECHSYVYSGSVVHDYMIASTPCISFLFFLILLLSISSRTLAYVSLPVLFFFKMNYVGVRLIIISIHSWVIRYKVVVVPCCL